ncbi:MAG: hypothetical protein NZM11_11720, partial [Anaerolineales bacterium]|nr:hypothetical protein [Anaerolineales bacterium]
MDFLQRGANALTAIYKDAQESLRFGHFEGAAQGTFIGCQRQIFQQIAKSSFGSRCVNEGMQDGF